MAQSPQIPDARLNVSLPPGQPEKLQIVRENIQKKMGVKLSWAAVIRYLIDKEHDQINNNNQ